MSHEHTKTPFEIATDIVSIPFMFPGGYRRHAITDDGGTLCSDCCDKEIDLIKESTPGDGWHVTNSFVHWEGDTVQCDNCGTEWASEYGPVSD